MSKSAGLRASLQPLLVTAFCFVLPLAAFGEIRVWKSKSGTYEVRGEMISSDAESVKLATEDGREIIVALAKLSQADRDYVANQSSISTKTDDAKTDDPESDDTEKKIKLVVAQFYRVVGLDGDPLREFLTDTGRASYDRSPNFYQDVRGPDRGQTPRVTQVTVNDEDNTAVADYRLRLAGKTLQMQMLFRLQEDQWRVSGIIGPGPGGTKNKMDFDNAQTITGATNPTPTTGKAENGPSRERASRERGSSGNWSGCLRGGFLCQVSRRARHRNGPRAGPDR